MFKEKKKKEEVLDQASNHKMKKIKLVIKPKKEMVIFTISFGEIQHTPRDKEELFIDKLELTLNSIIQKKNLKNILSLKQFVILTILNLQLRNIY